MNMKNQLPSSQLGYVVPQAVRDGGLVGMSW